MPILNYSTSVSVDKTVAEVQKILAQRGALEISMQYTGGVASGISFLIQTRYGERAFRFPINHAAVYTVLTRQYHQGKIPPRYATEEQALRVAWRIAKDWLLAQLAVIESEMVTLDEIMMPYMLLGDGETVYERMVSQQLALPPGGAS